MCATHRIVAYSKVTIGSRTVLTIVTVKRPTKFPKRVKGVIFSAIWLPVMNVQIKMAMEVADEAERR